MKRSYRRVPFLLHNPGSYGLYEVCPGEVRDEPDEDDGDGGEAGQAGGDGGGLDDGLQADTLPLSGPQFHNYSGRHVRYYLIT